MRFLISVLAGLCLAWGTPVTANAEATAGVAAFVVPSDIPPPPPDRAQIVFLKPTTSVAGAMPIALYRLDGEQRELLGIYNKEARGVVTLAPGRHRFMSALVMAIGRPLPHLMEADVEAGKRYFVLLRFIYGRGFQLRPIRPGTASDYDAGHPTFGQWLAGTQEQPVDEKQVAWFQRREAKVAKAQEIAEEEWLEKTEDEREQLRLRPEHAL